ncbi:MAG: hypothetical protein MPJ78_01420 [Hyphomicrobiaceae bacterium]|nr:hypothetical protein [Hyphomicrobiaceae bacterium]
MRHTEVLIMVVALLAKRPDAMNAFLPAPERISISQVYAGTQNGHPFATPARKGVKA